MLARIGTPSSDARALQCQSRCNAHCSDPLITQPLSGASPAGLRRPWPASKGGSRQAGVSLPALHGRWRGQHLAAPATHKMAQPPSPHTHDAPPLLFPPHTTTAQPPHPTPCTCRKPERICWDTSPRVPGLWGMNTVLDLPELPMSFRVSKYCRKVGEGRNKRACQSAAGNNAGAEAGGRAGGVASGWHTAQSARCSWVLRVSKYINTSQPCTPRPPG